MASKEHIPQYSLKHKDEYVSFAIRTSEEIYEEHGEKPDMPHRHDYYSIIWVKEGEGTHQIDFNNYQVKPGHIFCIAPGQIHQLVYRSHPSGVVILFTDEFLNAQGISRDFILDINLFETCDENPPIDVGAESEALNSISYTMFKELEKLDPYSYDVIGANLKLVLVICNRLSTKRPALDRQFSGSLVRDFKKAVESDFKNSHKVSDYAEYLNITSNHLNEVINAAIGKTAKAYIQDRIILEAKREAQFSLISSKQIAYQLGFNDPAHFSKFFKNCVGMSFSEFRKSIR